jgi:ferredoxin
VQFHTRTRFGRDISLPSLKSDYDAIVLATGRPAPDDPALPGIETSARGISIEPHTFRTSDPKLFAGGEAVQAGHLAIRALAHGRGIAISIDQYLRNVPVTGSTLRFESRLGSIKPAEGLELLKDADPRSRTQPEGGPATGFSKPEATQESMRCLHCDCRKAEHCKLRDHMEAHQRGPLSIPSDGRKPITRDITHPLVVFEPGKCIKCGICIRITAQAGETTGLAFLNRGFETEVGPPFGASLQTALGQAAAACIEACPTGALAWR